MSKECALRNFVYKSEIEAPVSALFAWHLQEGAFERLTPPWLDVKVRGGAKRLQMGLVINLLVRKFGVPMDLAFKIVELESDKKFVDQQLRGPFTFWKHEHKFESLEGERSMMDDNLHFAMPFGFLSEPIGAGLIEDDMKRMFRYRHEILKYDLLDYMKHRAIPRQNILLFGTMSGLTEPLLNFLTTQGHTVEVYPGNAVIKDQLHTESELAARFAKGQLNALVCMSPFCSANQWEIDMRRMFMEAMKKSKRQRPVCLDLHLPHAGKCYLTAWEQYCQLISSSTFRCIFAHFGEILTPAFGVLKNKPEWKDEAIAKANQATAQSAWIAVDDAIAAIEFCLLNETVNGKFSVAAPVSSVDANGLPPITSFGYEFRYLALEDALKHELGL